MRGLGTNVHVHDWGATEAAAMFSAAEATGKQKQRFATRHGIAFIAQPTPDGTWHGYPVPWEHVPAEVRQKWLKGGEVSLRQIKKYFRFEKSDIHWALKTDDR